MKKILLLLAVMVVGVISCQKEVNSIGNGRIDYVSFRFAILDSNRNNIFMLEDFNQEELLLEYEGKIFKPMRGVFQNVVDNCIGTGYNNSIIFDDEWSMDRNEYPVAFGVIGYARFGTPIHYIIRYRDNEWVVDIESEKMKNYELPKAEVYVNGVKVEKEQVYNNNTGKSLLLYVLYTK